MATSALSVPGVYIQEQFAKTAAVLPTGVPAFIGFVAEDAPAPADAPQLDNGYGPVLLNRKSDFPGGASDFLGDAVNGFFDNGGAYCYVVGLRLAATSLPTADPLVAALDAISVLSDVDLVAVPDAVALRDGNDDLIEADVLRVQREMIAHCMREGHRMALLDALPGKSAQALLDDQVGELGLDSTSAVNAALYHPWINTITSDTRVIPPCGHIAGIISRTDAATGVFKAPANVEIQGATDLDADLDVDALGLLNDAGVNCLRSFPGRGIRVFGARTLSRDPAWRYLNVRRLVLTILRWIDLNMTWAAFEPNVPALWARIQRELTTYLIALWRAGALQGASDSDAFYVRCNADLNPPEKREVGQVITEIGLAPARPAEFIIVTIQLRAGTTDLI